tara:strand:+ start:2173 stop:2841 length:669 start_codon:yes stop_codon:yes gene_type:complete
VNHKKIRYLAEMGVEAFWYKNSRHLSRFEENDNSKLDDVKKEIDNCERCDLSENRGSIVFGSGDEKSRVMIIGEAPGKDEDASGEPFVGRAGKLLDEILFAMGLSRKDVYITNTVKCRPPSNRNPNDDEILSCSDFLDKQIDSIKPSIIILLGKVAANRMLGINESMSYFRKKVFDFGNTKIPMFVFYHPAYLLRSPSQKKNLWDDINFIKGYLRENGGSLN